MATIHTFKVKVSKAAREHCADIMNADDATSTERDAANEVFNTGLADGHLTSVLSGYVCKQLEQNRWGK